MKEDKLKLMGFGEPQFESEKNILSLQEDSSVMGQDEKDCDNCVISTLCVAGNGTSNIYDEARLEESVANGDNSRLETKDRAQKATEILEKSFHEYDVSEDDDTTPFFVAAYYLNQLYFPDDLPENTGSLEDAVKKNIKLLLHNLQKKYPKAVREFMREFDIMALHNVANESSNSGVALIEDGLNTLHLQNFDVVTEKLLQKRIDSADEKEYLAIVKHISNSENACKVSQEYIDIIVAGGLEKVEKRAAALDDKYRLTQDPVLYDGILRSLIFNNTIPLDFSGDEIQRLDYESMGDKAFQSYVKCAGDYPIASYNVLDKINADAQVLRKDIWVKGIVQLWANEDLDKHFRDLAIHGINYMLSFNNYKEVLLEQLDFEHSQNFYHTGLLLDLMKRISFLGQDMHFSEGKSDKQVMNILQDVVKEDKGSYLLNMRARNVLQEMRHWRDSSEFGKGLSIFERYTDIPYALAKNMQGYYDRKEDIFYIGEVTQYELKPLIFVSQNSHSIKSWDQYVDAREVLSVGKSLSDDVLRDLYYDYKFFVRPDIFHAVARDFGIQFSHYTLPEQVQFVQFIKGKTRKELKSVKKFINQYTTDGFRVFLSLEHGGQEMGEKILKIGESYLQEVASQIFKKYGELADAADSVEEYLKEQFGGENPEAVKRVAENLLLRGKALLSTFADNDDIAPDMALLKLENIVTEVELFKESFKTMRMSGEEISLAELGAVQFHILTGPELAAKKDVVERMKDIYRENYSSEQFTEEFRTKLQESLIEKLQNSQSRFYTLYHKGKIVAFNSFTKQEDGSVHFANFNVDAQYNHSQLGNAMMDASLAKEMKQATIVAEGVPDAPITQVYKEKYGFEETGEVFVGDVRLLTLKREMVRNVQ